MVRSRSALGDLAHNIPERCRHNADVVDGGGKAVDDPRNVFPVGIREPGQISISRRAGYRMPSKSSSNSFIKMSPWPSPTARATRLIDPLLTSPAAKKTPAQVCPTGRRVEDHAIP